MTKTLKDYFKELEDKVVSLEERIVASNALTWNVDFTDLTRRIAVSDFSLVKGFIKAQPLENQRDLWLTIIDLLKDSKVFDDMFKEGIRKELLLDCIKELENLNYTILQLHTQKNTVKGNAKKANKPDTTAKGNAKKANKPDAKFNWQGKQTQLVYLIELLYEHGFLSPISQAEKHRLTAQHFTVNGKNLNQKTLPRQSKTTSTTKAASPKEVRKSSKSFQPPKIKIQAKPKQNPRQP
jgi:hypothetical protein